MQKGFDLVRTVFYYIEFPPAHRVMYLANYGLLCQQITTKEPYHKQFLALCLAII